MFVRTATGVCKPGALCQNPVCGVGVPQSLGLGLESKSESEYILRNALLRDCTLSLLLRGFSRCTFPAGQWSCYFKRVLSSCHFVCLYTVVHLVLEEFRISLKSSLSTQSVCHTVSPQVGVVVSLIMLFHL